MARLLISCSAWLLVSGLLLLSAAPAYGRYALEDFNLDGVTTAEFLAGVSLLLLAVVVGAATAPCPSTTPSAR